LRNGNRVKRSERIEAIPYVKRRMRSSTGIEPIIGKLRMRELEDPIS